jgi:hypothetical protein
MSNDNLEEIDDLTLADSIEAAFNEYESEEGRPEENTEKSVRDTETEKGTEPEYPVPNAGADGAEQPRLDGEHDNQPTQTAALKAPQSWKPAAREHWSQIPDSIKEEVLRRETQINQAFQETAQSRKVGDELLKAAQPYMPLILAENSTPVQAAENMFRTAAMLKTGAPMQKAQLLADIVRQYSIDINLLDQALSHGIQGPQAMPQSQPMYQQNPQQFSDPRVDQLFSMMEQTKVQKAQRMQEEANHSVNAFGQAHEFFEDVREEMADLIEVFEKRGVALSLEDAYNKAIALHPEISQVLAQRHLAQSAGASTARSRRAASSVKSRPAIGQQAEPDSLRGALEEAIRAAG